MAKQNDTEAFCGKCKRAIKYGDKICKYCGNDFSEVGKDLIFHVPTLHIGMTTELSKQLNKSEQKFVTKMSKWWGANVGDLQVSSIEIGFPSGVKVVFGKKTKQNDSHNLSL